MRAKTYDASSGGTYARAYDLTETYTAKYLSPDDRLLDFACGTGILTLRMAPHVSRVQAIDISPRMAALCRKKAAAQGIANVSVANLDLFDPSLEPGSFDVITAFNVMCYLPDLPKVLARIRELLAPGGLFLSATDCLGSRPSKVGLQKFIKSRTGAMPYVAFFTQRGLTRRIAGQGFQVLETKNLFAFPPNLFIAARKKS